MKLGKKRIAVGLPAIKNAGFLLVILLPFVLLYIYCDWWPKNTPLHTDEDVLRNTRTGDVGTVVYKLWHEPDRKGEKWVLQSRFLKYPPPPPFTMTTTRPTTRPR